MPNIHLYGGPASGRTVHVPGRPAYWEVPVETWDPVTAPFTVENGRVTMNMASVMEETATYLRITYLGVDGVIRDRYMHDALAPRF